MFGESEVASIPDHEVRAVKLTNRWISGSWWGRDTSSDEHLVGTKHGLLKCRSVRRKPPGEQWSRRDTVEVRGTKWNFDAEMDSGTPGPTLESRREQIHNNSGGGDVAAKKTKVIDRVVRCTNILGALEHLFRTCRTKTAS